MRALSFFVNLSFIYHICNFPPHITLWYTSSTGGLLRPQHDT